MFRIFRVTVNKHQLDNRITKCNSTHSRILCYDFDLIIENKAIQLLYCNVSTTFAGLYGFWSYYYSSHYLRMLLRSIAIE